MDKNIRISNLCSSLDPRYLEDMDVENDTDLQPSTKRIEDLVFQKLNAETNTAGRAGKRGHMRKKTWKILSLAAVLCLLAASVFAMAGGFDYFRSIFGDTARHVEQDIQSPGITAADDNRRITLESMLTDGYKINLIVSLKALSEEAKNNTFDRDPLLLFNADLTPDSDSSGQEAALSYTCSELEEFSTESRRFYHIQLDSLDNCIGWNLNLSLSQEMGQLSLSARVESTTAARQLDINRDIDGNLTVESIQISPLGALVIGSEKKASGGLPAPLVDINFLDGSSEELISPLSFDSGDGETILGGGSAVISDDPTSGPLVVTTYGMRNPDGKVVLAGEFGRIISMDQVKSITVDGVEYPVK
ncbi:MAG: DUF4179 domain-containing protein [Enterocloster asparagiformis]|nr:DUF4179 domain-containing protein [Enterocloster asparagiformis]